MNSAQAQEWLTANGFRPSNNRWWWWPPHTAGSAAVFVKLYFIHAWSVSVVSHRPLSGAVRTIHWTSPPQPVGDFSTLPGLVADALVHLDALQERGLGGLGAWEKPKNWGKHGIRVLKPIMRRAGFVWTDHGDGPLDLTFERTGTNVRLTAALHPVPYDWALQYTYHELIWVFNIDAITPLGEDSRYGTYDSIWQQRAWAFDAPAVLQTLEHALMKFDEYEAAPPAEPPTRVIFRRWLHDGRRGHLAQGIIAIFPDSGNGLQRMMYEHIGQHGDGDFQGVLEQTVPAISTEYRALARELQSIGYTLEVVDAP